MSSVEGEKGHSHRKLDNPARDGIEIVPDDNTDLAKVPRSLYVGGSGDIQVTFAGFEDGVPGATVTLVAVPIGVLPVQVIRVHAIDTTATNIVGLY